MAEWKYVNTFEDSESDDAAEVDKEFDVGEGESRNVNCFFRDLLNKRINFQISREEVQDIISSVDTIVETIVAKIASKIGWLPFSRLVKVGSMAEETKIKLPDEFDYLVVLGHPDCVEVDRVCKERRGYAHIKVTDKHLCSMWGKWIRDDYLLGEFKRGHSSMWPSYFDTLGNAFMYEVSNVLKSYDNDHRIETETGMLYPNHTIEKHGPAFTPKFIWTPKCRRKDIIINVDITPAIEMTLSPDIVTSEDSFHVRFWAKLQELNKYMLIPCHEQASCRSGLCFRLTFTEAEVSLVRDLSDHHKQCFKLLKYVFNSGDGYTYFPTYAWKTLILKHDCHCKEEHDLAKCFKTIVASCLHYLVNRTTVERTEPSKLLRFFFRGEKFTLNIPSIFIKDHNIFDGRDYKLPCEMFLLGIESMLHSLEIINRREEADEKDLRLVNSYVAEVRAYLDTLPLFNRHMEIDRCLKCLGQYFREDIL